jgi:hypothetical protein
LRLKVHIVDILLLLEGGTHGRRLGRATVRAGAGVSLTDVLRSTPLLLLIIVVLVHGRWWISQILKLHRVVRLHL